jgi:hypothetical protein
LGWQRLAHPEPTSGEGSGESVLGHEGRWDPNRGENREEAHRKSGFSQRHGSGREEQRWRHGPEVNVVGRLVGKLYGVTLVLAEDGVGQTRPEAVRHGTARLRRMACGEGVVRAGSTEQR